MTKNKSNIIYNTIYRIVIILTPLITSPYLARVLGPGNLGIYSSSYAFATWFVNFALLGVFDYGNRSIARVKDDKEALSDTFWQIYYLQFTLSILLTGLYVGSIFIIGTDINIKMILAIYVFSTIFEINWFAFGTGEFKLTSIRSIIIRILIVVCLLVFVKTTDDLWIYTIILTLGNTLSLLAILPLVKKYTYFRKPDPKKILSHLKPNLILFLPVIATSVYQLMDKVMLGFFSTNEETGFYQSAENIVNLPMFITTAIVTVMMPHSSKLISQGKDEENMALLNSTLKYTSILNIAMSFGMAAIATWFIPIFLGENYGRSAEIAIYLSPLIFISGYTAIVRYQLLIPSLRDKEYLISISIGAVLNLILNSILIPFYGAIGATIATLAAFVSVLIVQIIETRKEVNYLKSFLGLLPFLFVGAAMFAIVYAICYYMPNKAWALVISIAAGAAFYILLSILFLYISKDKDFQRYIHKRKKVEVNED